MRPEMPTPKAVSRLREMAADGDVGAMLRLASIVGAGVGTAGDYGRALALLRSARAQGSGVAGCILGVWGLQNAADEAAALDAWDTLEAAARMGDSVATTLVGELANARCDWRTLQAVAEPGAARVLRSRPLLSMVERMLSPLECLYVMSLARDALTPSAVNSTGVGIRREAAVRNSTDVSLSPWSQDIVIQRIAARICSHASQSVRSAEPLAIIRYAEGGFFSPHFDSPAEAFEGHPEHPWGPRTLSFIAYLNEEYDGGETAFPEARFQVRGAAGDAVFFKNETPDGHLDKSALHGALPVSRGEKWVLVGWFTRNALYPELMEVSEDDDRESLQHPAGATAVPQIV